MVTTRRDTSDAFSRLRARVRSTSTPKSGATTRITNTRLIGAGQPQS